MTHTFRHLHIVFESTIVLIFIICKRCLRWLHIQYFHENSSHFLVLYNPFRVNLVFMTKWGKRIWKLLPFWTSGDFRRYNFWRSTCHGCLVHLQCITWQENWVYSYTVEIEPDSFRIFSMCFADLFGRSLSITVQTVDSTGRSRRSKRFWLCFFLYRTRTISSWRDTRWYFPNLFVTGFTLIRDEAFQEI